MRRQRAQVRPQGEDWRSGAYARKTMWGKVLRGSGDGRSESVVAALFAGFLLRAFFVWHHPRFVGDTLVYGDLAENLLRHGVYGLTEDHIRPTLIRLPGYPLFLLACFWVFGVGRYVPVLWVQVAVDLLGCWLLGYLARRLFGARVGRAVLWLGVLCPFTANYPAAALTETLSILCVTLALWALARWQEHLRAGAGSLGCAGLIGCALTGAALLRPDGGLLAAVVVPAMLCAAWWWPRLEAIGGVGGRGRREGLDGPQRLKPPSEGRVSGRAKALPFHGRNHRTGEALAPRLLRGSRDALVASLLLCGALGFWAARNWRMFHVFQPLAPRYANDPGEDAPLGFARWYRTWGIGFGDTVRVYWVYDGSVENLSDLPARAFDDESQRRETAAIYARYNEETSSTPAIEAAFGLLAAERVRAHPVRYYALLPSARLLAMWLRPRTELMKIPFDWLRVRVHPGRSVFAIGYAGLNLLLLLAAALGCARWVRWGRRDGVVVWAGLAFVLLRSAMLMTIDNAEPRYTLECFPVVLLLAGLAAGGFGRQNEGVVRSILKRRSLGGRRAGFSA